MVWGLPRRQGGKPNDSYILMMVIDGLSTGWLSVASGPGRLQPIRAALNLRRAGISRQGMIRRMTTPLEALAHLSRQDPTPQYFSAFFIEVNAEKNDRGAAILLAANAELCLRYAIKRHLVTIDEAERTLFHSSGPLRSFEAKIRIGFTMGLFGEQTKQNLDCIKAIRNAFAHAIIPMSFETAEVKAVCELMTAPEILPPRTVDETGKARGILPDFPTPRQRFQKICEAVSHNLFIVALKRLPAKPATQQLLP
jgi:hypothetical protein